MSKCYNQAKINVPTVVSDDQPIDRAFSEEKPYKTKEDVLNALGITPEDVTVWEQERIQYLGENKFTRQYQTEEVKSLANEALQPDSSVTEEQVIESSINAKKEAGQMPKLWTTLPETPTYEMIAIVNRGPQRGIINTGNPPKGLKTKKLLKGMPVVSRLDIPSYNKFNVWVVTVHKPDSEGEKGKAIPGQVLGYAQTAHLKDVIFNYTDATRKKGLRVMSGKEKNPFAGFRGKWQDTDTKDVRAVAQSLFDKPEWTQVAMNPDIMGQYFFDRATLEPVKSADEVYQIGPLLFAKNVKYLRKQDNKPTRSNPFKFAYTQDIFTALDNGEFIIANNYAYRKQHNFQRKGDKYVQPYSIYDKKSKQKIGFVEIEQVQEGDKIDVKDRVTGIINIELDESARGNNAGTKIVQSIMAMSPETKSFRKQV